MDDTNVPDTGTTTMTYLVTGMTCDHCVAAVREEVGAIASVQEVEIDLVSGGTSRVTLTATAVIPVNQVRAAVAEAGYTLAEASR
jgi:copper chaperone